MQFFHIFYVYHDHLLFVGRGFLTSYFMKTPPILPTPYPLLPPRFQILSNHSFPITSNLHPAALFVVLFLWLNGWSYHIWCIISLNDIMDLTDPHMSSLGTFVPEVPCYVFYATRPQIYWGLIHNGVFCWYSDLILQTHTHTHTLNVMGPGVLYKRYEKRYIAFWQEGMNHIFCT